MPRHSESGSPEESNFSDILRFCGKWQTAFGLRRRGRIRAPRPSKMLNTSAPESKFRFRDPPPELSETLQNAQHLNPGIEIPIPEPPTPRSSPKPSKMLNTSAPESKFHLLI